MNSLLNRIIFASITLFTTYLGICSFFTFDPSWDFLAYHLPHSLILFDHTSYSPGPILKAVMEGFPPLPHYVQGMLISLTGRPSSANFINFIALVAFFSYAWRRLHFRNLQMGIFTSLVLSIPLVQIHVTAGYVDLWSNIPIVIAFFEYQFFRKTPRSTRLAFIIIGLCSFSVLSKYLMWPLASLIASLTILTAFKHQKASKAVFVLAFAFVALGYWPTRNLVKYNNPFYPVSSSIFKTAENSDLIALNADARDQMPEYLIDYPRPVSFMFSALEVSRFFSDKPLNWSIDQWAEGEQQNAGFRMGGWAITTILLLLGALAFGFRTNKSVSLYYFGIVAITSFLPQSHELRYWFYVPLIASVLTVYSWDLMPRKPKIFFAIACGLNFLIISSRITHRLDFAPPISYAPEKVRSFIATKDKGHIYKVCDLPFDILYTGKDFAEISVIGCY